MSVVINISKTYRKPIQTYSRLFELGASEKQNLAFLIGGCVISFVSQWPVQARYAFANQQSIDELMGAILLSNLFLLPLIFYFISMVMYIFAKGLGSNILGVELRMIIFWAYLAATTIFAPSAAAFFAIARPLPLLPPEIKITFSFKLIFLRLS